MKIEVDWEKRKFKDPKEGEKCHCMLTKHTGIAGKDGHLRRSSRLQESQRTVTE